MANAKRAVTIIPASLNLMTHLPETIDIRRRVAGYARVSTESEEQATSYEAQIDYYTKYIKDRSDWEFVDVYTDEGISATNTRRRGGFNKMIADAMDGKIDLIVTKSVSRFARNTVDSLVTIRKLKERGVEVYFEKENIWTLDSKGELLITIMSSIAQEESRSISENVTWGQRKRFADGKVSLPYKHFLGYEKGPDGIPQIVPEEAKLVRRIYSMFISGKTPGGIAKVLTAEGIPSPSGKPQWQSSTVDSILTNEKYKGAALLQKRFTVDFLQKKMKVNEGEVPQYFVENSHEAIIPPVEWETVNREIARRKALGGRYSGNSLVGSRLVCADCGSFFGAKIWHSNTAHRRVVLRCNGKYSGDTKCTTPAVTEDDVIERFLTVYNKSLLNKEELLDAGREVQNKLSDCEYESMEIERLIQAMEVLSDLISKNVHDNSRTIQDQQTYQARYDTYTEKYRSLQKEYETVLARKQEKETKADAIAAYLFSIMESDYPVCEFDPLLWLTSIQQVQVHSDGKLTFWFTDGQKIDG